MLQSWLPRQENVLMCAEHVAFTKFIRQQQQLYNHTEQCAQMISIHHCNRYILMNQSNLLQKTLPTQSISQITSQMRNVSSLLWPFNPSAQGHQIFSFFRLSTRITLPWWPSLIFDIMPYLISTKFQRSQLSLKISLGVCWQLWSTHPSGELHEPLIGCIVCALPGLQMVLHRVFFPCLRLVANYS